MNDSATDTSLENGFYYFPSQPDKGCEYTGTEENVAFGEIPSDVECGPESFFYQPYVQIPLTIVVFVMIIFLLQNFLPKLLRK